jgi:hypothetical protein
MAERETGRTESSCEGVNVDIWIPLSLTIKVDIDKEDIVRVLISRVVILGGGDGSRAQVHR